ncbi:hypothetical protein [Mucilaginibacter pocheonensis]|uniref:NHL repeat-containing protein n=1 Tax=Mucilaginibacter pocheonensis TaxID=398050 RepID=A0ABU1TIU8_9SPHI|nr:hypothetical protein [Mucilaginibacter pocheonensis]MDR6945272.1 hypothetical protein [Mucilaginibacter pocheonensis]
MKVNQYKLLLFCAMLSFYACKKEEQSSVNKISETSTLHALAADSGQRALRVITIAGKVGVQGYVDGAGAQARFTGPGGIELMDDGTIYIADTYNKKIRKIMPDNTVSTVNIPKSDDGQSLVDPSIIRITKDGTMNILCVAYRNLKHPVWIIKPDGKVLTPPKHSDADKKYSYEYLDLEKDPYTNFLWIGGVRYTYINNVGYATGELEKFLIDGQGTIGTDIIFAPTQITGGQLPVITSFFCGYNAVKYVVMAWRVNYKYTADGKFAPLNFDKPFSDVSSIIATKDSRTLYVAQSGIISSIFNGKVTYLVGPHKNLHGKDGIGVDADVYAFKLALSKDESTLYFTDGYASVRKLILRN